MALSEARQGTRTAEIVVSQDSAKVSEMGDPDILPYTRHAGSIGSACSREGGRNDGGYSLRDRASLTGSSIVWPSLLSRYRWLVSQLAHSARLELLRDERSLACTMIRCLPFLSLSHARSLSSRSSPVFLVHFPFRQKNALLAPEANFCEIRLSL